MDNDVHRTYPPPAPEDRVDGDLDGAHDIDLDGARDVGSVASGPRDGGARSRLAPPAPDQRVELTGSYLPWVVLVTLLGLAVAVYFLL
ncbi:hypothetical protein KZX45_16845 [Georgenia sp. EYE_87]|uniref:hypothetical protein n=1 Tax=Georgenia sp. EYE_87 TaxID=2853448 RepID=UPI002003DCFD|nr:hypothetical protein [Georgenia sp. EYE_87]MCK6212212.1 hypothetical protein [Georgenia sp. EYE_87]